MRCLSARHQHVDSSAKAACLCAPKRHKGYNIFFAKDIFSSRENGEISRLQLVRSAEFGPRPPRSARARAASAASCRGMRQTLQGSFSAVSKSYFASKYAFESSRRDLHNALLCTALQSQFVVKNAPNCLLKKLQIRQN